MKTSKNLVTGVSGSLKGIRTRDGIIDIILGFVIIIVAITFKVDTTPSPVLLAIIIPILVKNLRKKYIYPRLEQTVVQAELQRKAVMRQWVIAMILAAGTLGFVLTLSIQNTHVSSPLFNVVGILISGTVILGGISSRSIYYFYALVLSVPMIALQFSHKLWMGMALLSIITLLVILGIVWIGLKQYKKQPGEDTEGYEKVTHAFLAEAGWVFFVYFLLATYLPEFAGWARTLISSNAEIVFGYAGVFFILLMGFVFKTTRYYLYAVLLSMSLIIYKKLSGVSAFPQVVLMIPGLLILVWGIILLVNFVKTNPLIPVSKE